MKNLFLTLVKGIILLIGIAMLAGGGICTMATLPISIKEPSALSMLIIAVPIAVLGYALIRWVFPNKKWLYMDSKVF
jgi:hypothetical protein